MRLQYISLKHSSIGNFYVLLLYVFTATLMVGLNDFINFISLQTKLDEVTFEDSMC